MGFGAQIGSILKLTRSLKKVSDSQPRFFWTNCQEYTIQSSKIDNIENWDEVVRTVRMMVFAKIQAFEVYNFMIFGVNTIFQDTGIGIPVSPSPILDKISGYYKITNRGGY